MAGLNEYSGVWGKAQVVHLLKRCMFGCTHADLNYFLGKGMINSVNELLTQPSAPSPPLNFYEGIDLNGTPVKDFDGIKAGETWINGTYGDGTTNFYRGESLKSWWIGNMIHQSRSIEEKMILFWHGHFVTELQAGSGATAAYKLIELFRKEALGSFRNLMLEVTKNTMMLHYLNGFLNTKYSPDENYARELQELFGVGKGSGSKFTESDVREAARVLTGLSMDWNTQEFQFKDVLHDIGDKQFSAFYNHKVIKGKSGSSGLDELSELIDMILSTDECARYICRRIYRFFVDSEISTATEQDVISPLAAIFRQNYSVKPVMEKLLKSEHFYETSHFGVQIKSPLDYVVGIARELGSEFPPLSNFKKRYTEILYGYYYPAAAMQQALGNPPSVAGWPAYYQEPQYYRLWTNSDTLPKRVNFSLVIVYALLGSPPDLLKFSAGFNSVKNPNDFIDDLVTLFYSGFSVSSTYKNGLKTATLLSGQTQDHYWTDAWSAYESDPTNATAKNTVLTRLRALLDVLMSTSEYHLC